MKKMTAALAILTGLTGTAHASSMDIVCSNADQTIQLFAGHSRSELIIKKVNPDGSQQENRFSFGDFSSTSKILHEEAPKVKSSSCENGVRGYYSTKDFVAQWTLKLHRSKTDQTINPVLLCRETIMGLAPCE